MIETSYSEARNNLAAFYDKAVDDRETVIVKRRGKPDLALIAADELASLQETVYLLRSPANARRLFDAIEQADRGEGIPVSDEELASLRREVLDMMAAGREGVPPTLERLQERAHARVGMPVHAR